MQMYHNNYGGPIKGRGGLKIPYPINFVAKYPVTHFIPIICLPIILVIADDVIAHETVGCHIL